MRRVDRVSRRLMIVPNKLSEGKWQNKGQSMGSFWLGWGVGGGCLWMGREVWSDHCRGVIQQRRPVRAPKRGFTHAVELCSNGLKCFLLAPEEP